MKVLIVHHQMALYGGAEVVVVRLAQYLQKHGHEVSILAASSAPHLEYESLNIITPSKEVSWHLWDGAFHSLGEIGRVYLALRSLYAKHASEYDAINVHNFPAIWAVPKTQKSLTWMCNEVPDLWHRTETKGLVDRLLNVGRLSDRLIVRSKAPTAVVADEQCADRFYRRYGLQSHIIPYGIDGEFFAQEATADWRPKFRIIQPSMVSPSKGQLEVLRAVKGLDVEVLFVGYVEPQHLYTKRLEQYMHDNDLDTAFTGHVGREALRTLYKTSYLAVFPGKGQGSWLGPFEALAAGTPIVVSPNLSCSSLIREKNLGIVTNDLRGAIKEVFMHYSKYHNLALEGQRFVLDSLTWDNFGMRMTELMNETR